MQLLLDTHTFIWWASPPNKLSSNALMICQNLENTLYLSVVSLWEIQIKSQLGKLNLSGSLQNLVKSQQQQNKLNILPVYLEHIFTLDSLPLHHKDPFDRLLIAQVLTEQFILVSKDLLLKSYGVNVWW